MDKDIKEKIDNMPFPEMFHRLRFDPWGSPYFAGEIGDYFMEVFEKKREEVGQDEYVRVSKQMGW